MKKGDVDILRQNPEVKDIYTHLCASLKLGRPVVSVGSGNGITEALTREFCGSISTEIIAVDPFPNMYCPAEDELWKTFSIKPLFPTVSELILKRPKIVGNCVMWLIWPPYFLEFDFEALILLQPTHLVILTDLMGTGCSPTMNFWLSQCGIPTRWKNFKIAGSNLGVNNCGVRPFFKLGAKLAGETIHNNSIGPENAPVNISTQHRLLAR